MALPAVDSGSTHVKVAFSLPEDELEELSRLAAERRVSRSEVLRSAIAFERFLADLPSGSNVWIESPDGELREIVPSPVEAASPYAPHHRRTTQPRDEHGRG